MCSQISDTIESLYGYAMNTGPKINRDFYVDLQLHKYNRCVIFLSVI
jgi:hypothetical protein